MKIFGKARPIRKWYDYGVPIRL